MVKCPGASHCFLKQNGLHECRCPSEDECPSTGEKVCGSDGISYDNECKLKAAACRSGGGLVLKKEGSCGKYKEIICCVTAVRFILLILPGTLFYGLCRELNETKKLPPNDKITAQRIDFPNIRPNITNQEKLTLKNC